MQLLIFLTGGGDQFLLKFVYLVHPDFFYVLVAEAFEVEDFADVEVQFGDDLAISHQLHRNIMPKSRSPQKPHQ